jgi:NAD(P)H dehydrogenase (quinone)
MPTSHPVLVTGAAGQVGGIGGLLVETLRDRGVPVRAAVRSDDARAAALRLRGAEVAVADLTRPEQVVPVLDGCTRAYFGMSVSPSYLEATLVMASAARTRSDLELLVNISQMTVSQMDLTRTTDSPQHRQHWLGEQALNWSGVPVAHIRPTVFQENPLFMALVAKSIADSGTLRLPFGTGRTSPVAARDVAEVIAAILLDLLDPKPYVGQVVELTGPRSVDLYELANEYSSALDRPVTYMPLPLEDWRDELSKRGLPDHLFHHLLTMAELHAANRYDRHTDGVARILGRAPTSLHETVIGNGELFQPSGRASQCQ